MAYDATGMLQSTIVDGGATQDFYIYTADDERLWTYDVQYNSSNALVYEKSTFTVRDLGGNVLRRFEQTPTGGAWTLARDYYYRDGLLLSSAAGSTSTVEHFTLDHLGTPRLITDGAKNKIGFHVYFPFGEEWFPATNVVQEAESRKFTGHERDRDLGSDQAAFDYMHARFYLSTVARFASPDPGSATPALPQSWNLYAYTRNNPTGLIDRNGREPLDPNMRQFLEAFLHADLSRVNVYGGWFARFLTKLFGGVQGVTIGQSIFFDPASFQEYKGRTLEGVVLTGHESTHAGQYQVQGLPRFLKDYLGQYLANRKAGMSTDEAYRAITVEKQAYANDALIRKFLTLNPEILNAIQAGIPLTDAQLTQVRGVLATTVGLATTVNVASSWENHYLPVIGTDGGTWLYCTDGDCR